MSDSARQIAAPLNLAVDIDPQAAEASAQAPRDKPSPSGAIRGVGGTAVERAFELARSGDCQTTGAIKRRLRDEGWEANQVYGPVLMRQLLRLCREHRR